MKIKIIFLSVFFGMVTGLNAHILGPKADSGAVIGGVAGAIIGNNSGSGNGTRGAIIGATTGLILGTIADRNDNTRGGVVRDRSVQHVYIEYHSRCNLLPRHRPRSYPHGTRYKMVVTEVIIYDKWGYPHVRRHYSYIPYR